jgi:hypothetical protein
MLATTSMLPVGIKWGRRFHTARCTRATSLANAPTSPLPGTENRPKVSSVAVRGTQRLSTAAAAVDLVTPRGGLEHRPQQGKAVSCTSTDASHSLAPDRRAHGHVNCYLGHSRRHSHRERAARSGSSFEHSDESVSMSGNLIENNVWWWCRFLFLGLPAGTAKHR